MTGARAALESALAAVAAPGTDPARLGAVLAWVVRPRRSADALRRIVRDHVDGRGGTTAPSAAVAAAAGTPEEVAAVAARTIADTWRRVGVRVALVGDPSYPARLADGWPDLPAPVLAAWRGAPVDDQPAVAIVGSRRASGYGVAVAAWLADAAAAAGARVVSGGALGVDAAAHEAALPRPGGTTVVLGCGHAVDYPRAHAQEHGLFQRIIDHGGTLLSELLPHEPPRAGQVRARNRIVAGLVDVVVVVEGGSTSGALLTANDAAEWGRTVLAVPGDVRAPGSAAPHRLLQEGAAPCGSPADLLDALRSETGAVVDPSPPGDVDAPTRSGNSHSGNSRSGNGRDQLGTLPEEVLGPLMAAWPRPVRLEELARRVAIPPARLLAILTRARIAGEIADGPDGVLLRRRPDMNIRNNS